jgi:proteasome lid subunit RPN8/RPN11
MKAKTKQAPGQPFVLIDSEVVRKIRQHARSVESTEICGVLIGRDKDQRIEVTASIEGENADQAGAHVTFTQDTWEHIYAVKDKKHPNDRIVGWYHSHPGFGIFLSEHDTFIHKNFFSSPGQVAWVFDPESDEEGCFGWVDGRIERLSRIAVQDRRGGEAAETVASRESKNEALAQNQMPQHQMAPYQEEEHSSAPRAAEPLVRVVRDETVKAGDDSASLEDLVTKVFFSLSLLLLGGLISWYFLPRTVVVPVLIDPRNGNLVDPQTGDVVGQLKPRDTKQEGADAAKAAPAPPPESNEKKTDDAHSK